MHASATLARLQFSNILFATDFSAPSLAALEYAREIAGQYAGHLWITHVVPEHAPMTMTMEPFPIDMDPLWRDAQERLKGFQQEHPLPDVAHDFLIEQGPLWEVLSKVAKEHCVDLIVMGTHGRTGFSRMLMGSTAEEIFRRADCPVLTVGPNVKRKKDGIQTILFPVDFSPLSERALPYALSLAEENEASLVMLHCITLAPAEYREDIELGATVRMKNLIPESAWSWCKPDFEVRFEIAIEGILASTKARDADLIVMGVHKSEHSRAVSHMPWVIASELAAKAPCPVMTVRR